MRQRFPTKSRDLRTSLRFGRGMWPGWAKQHPGSEPSLFRRQHLLAQRQAKPIPDLEQRFGETIDQDVVVIGRGRDAQPFGALGDRRIVDRLDVDTVLL